MRAKNVFILISAISLTFLITGLNFAQEEKHTIEIPAEPEVQWIWGEVVSVDTQKNELLVKYLDYDTDTESEIVMNVDDGTTYENINSLDQIKLQDNVSIDYIVDSTGKNIARNISIEKPESTEEFPEQQEMAPTEEITQQNITE